MRMSYLHFKEKFNDMNHFQLEKKYWGVLKEEGRYWLNSNPPLFFNISIRDSEKGGLTVTTEPV